MCRLPRHLRRRLRLRVSAAHRHRSRLTRSAGLRGALRGHSGRLGPGRDGRVRAGPIPTCASFAPRRASDPRRRATGASPPLGGRTWRSFRTTDARVRTGCACAWPSPGGFRRRRRRDRRDAGHLIGSAGTTSSTRPHPVGPGAGRAGDPARSPSSASCSSAWGRIRKTSRPGRTPSSTGGSSRPRSRSASTDASSSPTRTCGALARTFGTSPSTGAGTEVRCAARAGSLVGPLDQPTARALWRIFAVYPARRYLSAAGRIRRGRPDWLPGFLIVSPLVWAGLGPRSASGESGGSSGAGSELDAERSCSSGRRRATRPRCPPRRARARR